MFSQEGSNARCIVESQAISRAWALDMDYADLTLKGQHSGAVLCQSKDAMNPRSCDKLDAGICHEQSWVARK